MVGRDKIGAKRDTVRVGIVAVDRGLSVASSGLADVFDVANYWWRIHAGPRAGRFETTLLAGSRSLQTFTGRPTQVDATLDEWCGGDVVICSAVAVQPTEVVDASGELVRWLRQQARRPGVTFASVCTGAFFLAEAGLLAGLRATTNPLYARVFAQRYPDVRLVLSRVLVDEGRCITSGTVSAGLNLALHFVERYAGVAIAALTAKAIAVDKNRETQEPYLIPPRRLEEGDELTVRAQRWIEGHHADPEVTLATIAASLAVGTRTLQRRFVTVTGDGPMEYLRLVRIEAAKRLLESSQETVDSITWQVGYRDPRSFARLFRSYAALTPTAYRARFGATDAKPRAHADAASGAQRAQAARRS